MTDVGTWRTGALFEPAGGETPGGDRFALEPVSGALAFYLADATGHGRQAARFWEAFDGAFRDPWRRFAAEPNEHTLVQFASLLNDELHRRSSGSERAISAQLCLAAGWISNQGSLVFATFGLGVHVIPVTPEGSWRIRLQEAFGFRLGWVPSSDWPAYDHALVIHRIPCVTRLLLASDAFFGDDHLDPERAFERVQELGRTVANLPAEDALTYVAHMPHADDDATFVILEPAASS